MQLFTFRLYKFCIWIMSIAYVNLLWIFFSIVGLVFLGMLPSTVAMFGVIRKWILGEDVSVFKTFWNLYKKDFFKSNILGYTLLIVGIGLYVSLQLISSQAEELAFFLICAMLPLVFFYLVISCYFFPVFVHYEMRMKDYFKWSLILGMKNPLLTISMLLIFAVITFVTLFEIPAAFLFFGGSVTGFALMWGANQTFEKVEVNYE